MTEGTAEIRNFCIYTDSENILSKLNPEYTSNSTKGRQMATNQKSDLTMTNIRLISIQNQGRFSPSELIRKVEYVKLSMFCCGSSIEKSPKYFKQGTVASGMTISLWPFSFALLGSVFGDTVYGA